jgi:hypothetical protein
MLGERELCALATCVRAVLNLTPDERMNVAAALCKTLIEERPYHLIYEEIDRERSAMLQAGD